MSRKIEPWKGAALVAAWSMIMIGTGGFLHRAGLHRTLEAWVAPEAASAATLDDEHPVLRFHREFLERNPPLFRFRAGDPGEAVRWKDDLRGALSAAARLDAFPPRPPREAVRLVRRELRADHVIELREVPAEPGLDVPFTVLAPRDLGPGERRPAVLVLPGHGRGREDCLDRESYQRGNALELVRRGFVVAVPELRGFGALGTGHGWSDDPCHVADIRFNLRVGRTAIGAFLHDSLSVFDYLAGREDVHADRLGIAGCSLGGTLSLWLAALDPRVRAVVASATLPGPRRERDLPAAALGPPVPLTEFDIPGLARIADLRDIACAAAPAALLIDADPRDQRGVEASAAYVRAAYEARGAAERLSFQAHDRGHTFSVERGCDFLERWLVPAVPALVARGADAP